MSKTAGAWAGDHAAMTSYDPLAIARGLAPFEFHPFAPFNAGAFAVFHGSGVDASQWEMHPDTDELFLVLSGQLTIQMRDRNVVLAPGEIFVVPRGTEHCPRADTETALLLFEPSSVVNTGDAGGELTAEVEQLA